MTVLIADLTDTWLDEWAAAGLAQLETYLAAHLAFARWLDKERP